ncbi:uncharacterized protein LOC130755432 [Actinidia eriantha]|uniref:uncharacterized protein LOC130755432 n=1 Tax=Actinidia eriantha TaxID=165200 RepID=UPI002587521F|nr:uncharacterized protein LOC130755432 [Actinidia eriantha]
MSSRQRSESLAIHSSSIALLQERFRQLQRAKEMREEKELMKQVSKSHPTNSPTCHDPSRLFFNSELIAPPRPPPLLQDSSSSLHHRMGQSKNTETILCRSSNYDDSDIDTSLHL